MTYFPSNVTASPLGAISLGAPLRITFSLLKSITLIPLLFAHVGNIGGTFEKYVPRSIPAGAITIAANNQKQIVPDPITHPFSRLN
jgi:hypothetical protein